MALSRFVSGMIRITRPGNVLICAFAVFTGSLLGGKPFDLLGEAFGGIVTFGPPAWLPRALAAAVSAALILAAGNVHNDLLDHAADKVNVPGRPIPSGRVGRTTAWVLAAVLAAAGLAFSVPVGKAGIVTASAATGFLALYNSFLKRVPLAGNAVVALLGGLGFVYGGMASGAVREALIPAAFATLFHFGREIIKDAADVRGDTMSGIRTSATAWGVHTAVWIASFAFILLGIAVSLPYALGRFHIGYFLIVAAGIWPVIAWSAAISIIHPSEANLRKVAFVLKLVMSVGVFAVLAGFQGW